MSAAPESMEPQGNFFERTWITFKRYPISVKVFMVAIPLLVWGGLGGVYILYKAVEKKRSELLYDEIVEFVKAGKQLDDYGRATNEELAKSSLEAMDGNLKVYGWRVRTLKSTNMLFEQEKLNVDADVFFVGLIYEQDGEIRSIASCEVIWSQKIVRSISKSKTLCVKWGLVYNDED